MKNHKNVLELSLAHLYTLISLTVLAVLIYLVRDALTLFTVAFIISYLLNPLVKKLQKIRIPHSIAILFSLLILISAFLFLLSFIIPIFEQQIKIIIAKLTEISENFDFHHFKILEYDFKPYAMEIKESLFNFSSQVITIVNHIILKILRSGFVIGNVISIVIFAPILSFFLLKEWSNIYKGFINILPLKYKKSITKLTTDLDNTLSGYLNGQFLVCMILGIFYAISFTILKIDNSIALGLLVGLLVFIPYLGAIFSAFFVTLIGIVQFNDFSIALHILSLFAIAQTVESYFLTPTLVGKRIGLHPIWIILGLIVFSSIFGLSGILLALPLTAISSVFIRFFMSIYKNSAFFKNK